jgi:hypothetical protein
MNIGSRSGTMRKHYCGDRIGRTARMKRSSVFKVNEAKETNNGKLIAKTLFTKSAEGNKHTRDKVK